MAGCGGACTCGRQSEAPRYPASIADAVAKVIVDNRIVRFTIDYIRNFPLADADEIVSAANLAKERGELV